MSSAEDVARAKVEAEAARTGLFSTVGELQERLNPKVLAREGVDRLRERGSDLADEAVEAARARPEAAAGIAAGVVVLLLRKPLFRMVRRLFSRKRKTSELDAG